jgi:hypothetical protein
MTVLVDRRGIRGDLDTYIDHLESLIAHLKNLKAGTMPSKDELAAAPLLDRYMPALRAAECLVGFVTGHPTQRGTMTTSDLWAYAPSLGWARTFSRLYRLGRPAGVSDRPWH